jgi:hypothetical protein
MVRDEIREDVIQKCIEKVAYGDGIVLSPTKTIRDETGCKELGASMDMTISQNGFTPKKAYESGLLGVDALINWDNFKEIYDYHEYDIGWEISDANYKEIKRKGLNVQKISPLTVYTEENPVV